MSWADVTTLHGGAEDGEVHFLPPTVRRRLTSVYPARPSVVFDLEQDRVVLGRRPGEPGSPGVRHGTVSREHFAIEWDESQMTHVGRDLGSSNGSKLQGKDTKEAWQTLHPGYLIRIGDVLFVYEDGHTLDEQDSASVSQTAVPGRALSMRRLRHQIGRAAPDPSPALIIGETGTGKEKIAAELHHASGRDGEFVAVNCATLGTHLIESQLFGHVKGAFTGADSDQPGLFRAAEGGTLFLDEIGEMPLDLQPKLLRAIQEREVRPVGSTKTEKVDVRVVAATHQDLAARAREGRFRQDLYARLSLWELHVPALRERRSDIPIWIDRLHEVWLEERNLSAATLQFDADAMEEILLHAWPENLRGLNRLVHDVARVSGRAIRKRDFPGWMR